jgi:UMF1 family MFS transporter
LTITAFVGKEKHSRRRSIAAWTFYDFANSSYTTLIVTFIYSTFFTKVIAADEITGTVLWSRAVNITAIVVAVLSPFLGTIADQGNYRKRFLLLSTITAILGSAMLYTALPGQVMKALTWFVISNIAFEMGSVFYNAYLPDIAKKENIGRISGYGWAFGYAGGLLAMLTAMIGFVNPETPWFGLSKMNGENIRATNLLVAAWFFVFSIPAFIILNGSKKRKAGMGNGKIAAAIPELLNTFKEIKKYRQIVLFLLSRLIYNDGLVTIFAFGGIYAAGTFNFSFEEIMIFGVVLNVAAGIGAFIMGFFDDKLGGKKTVQASLLALIAAVLIAVFAPNKTLFWVSGIIVGFFSGPNQAASRSLMGRFVPKNKINEFFGFFALSGKLTAFLGPLLLGIFTDIFKSQRAGISVVLVFFILGGLLLVRVDEKAGIKEAGRTAPEN